MTTEVDSYAASRSSGSLPEARTRGSQAQCNRLSLDIGVPLGRVTDILNSRRAITADTAVRLGLYFGNSAQFWLDLRAGTTLAWSSGKRARSLPSASGRRMRREPPRVPTKEAEYAPLFRPTRYAFEWRILPSTGCYAAPADAIRD